MMRKFFQELFHFGTELFFHSFTRTTARVRVVKGLLWFIAGVGATVAAARLLHGLGAATALTDTTPWGLWIGFDVVGGVALAAGGFVIAAAVYIFHLHRYHGIVRPAVLTAFLGYGAVSVGLIFDLGLWWNIWRPMFFWQHHSALFEVAWCVMLYLTVLAFEFAPVVLEKMPFPRLFKFFKTITLPLVILGIMLSTLHQSSLGTLFLIMPYRIYPLWYSTLQPLHFFISAIALGLSMVILESLVSGWLYQRASETHLLASLARAAAYVLGIYLLVKLGDLAYHGKLALLLQPNWETAVFCLEMLLSAILPIALFAVPRIRQSKTGLSVGAGAAVLGFIFNRINVSGISTIAATGTRYFPSWTEFAVSLAVVSAAMLVFFFFVEHFSVYESPAETPGAATGLPRQDPVSGVYLESTWAGDAALYSFIFIVAMAVGFYALPPDAVSGAKPLSTPVQSVRTVSAIKSMSPGRQYHQLQLASADSAGLPTSQDLQVLLLDGNRDGRFVLFDHEDHQKRLGGKPSCALCHHLNKPFDRATSCSSCHRDMYLPTDIFNHDLHRQKLGGNQACLKCHARTDLPKNRATATPCITCHRAMPAPGSRVHLTSVLLENPAPSYMDAVHGLCINCHREAAVKKPELGPDLARCVACHQESDSDYLKHLPSYPNLAQSQLRSALATAPDLSAPTDLRVQGQPTGGGY
jgi:Ni/Fe-hydrogenase subunit HybB-like protein